MEFKKLLRILAPVLLLSHLYSTSIDTTSGVDINKSITVGSLWVLSGSTSDNALGSVAFTEGVSVTGTGNVQIGVYFPIQKQLNLRNARSATVVLTQDLHLADGCIIYCPTDGSCVITSSGPQKTIYLDGNVTISGVGTSVSSLGLVDVDIDGRGYSLNLGNNRISGALEMANQVGLHNITINNGWFDYFTNFGSFLPTLGTFTLDNVNFIIRKNMSLQLAMYGSQTPINYIIRGNTIFGNFGLYYLMNIGVIGASYFVIEENSSLTIKDSTFSSGLWVDQNDGKKKPIRFLFKSDSSQLILDNGIFENNNVHQGAVRGSLDQTITLTKGTLIVSGNSTLRATTDLFSADRTATFSLGDGVDASNDFNIIINPGATLNVVATTTNSAVIFKNVH